MSQLPSRPPANSIDARLSGPVAADTEGACRSVLGTYAECPLCGSELLPEHAHFKCAGCGWRDSCCD